MNDYLGDDNHIGYGADVWQIGLLILYMLNGGHLGVMDIGELEHSAFYGVDDEEASMETKADIFDSWHCSLFGPGMPYKKAVTELFKSGRIGATLFDLLGGGMLVKDPLRRLSIEEVMEHQWFAEEDTDYEDCLQIGDERINLFDAIMSDAVDIQKAVRLHQIALLKGDDVESGTSDQCKTSISMGTSEEESPEINFYFEGDVDDMTEDTDCAPRFKSGYVSSETAPQSTRKRTMSF